MCDDNLPSLEEVEAALTASRHARTLEETVAARNGMEEVLERVANHLRPIEATAAELDTLHRVSHGRIPGNAHIARAMVEKGLIEGDGVTAEWEITPRGRAILAVDKALSDPLG